MWRVQVLSFSCRWFYKNVATFRSCRRVVENEYLNDNKTLDMKNYLVPFLFLLFACQVEQEPVRLITAGEVKSVTTTFISHQGDTQQKQDQIVSVAEFHPDGSLIRLTNHMTYPYDHSQPFEAEFWTKPNGDNLVHVMDGLHIGGEWNFLYGNDWPRKYADLTEEEQHPVYGDRHELYWSTFQSTVPMRNAGLPLHIISEAVYQGNENFTPWLDRFEERFEYEAGKVSYFETATIFHQGAYISSNDKESKKVNVRTPRSAIKGKRFGYEGDNLISFSEGDIEHKYFYENDRLIRSEFHLRGKMRNHRVYFYNDLGLKEKTEIFNTYGEPEYTIEYHYDFYDQS